MALARHAGMRIHEVMRLDAATARKALKTGILTFKGKNGLWRSVPINEQVRIALRDSLAHTKPGQKLFVPEGEKTHEVIKELEAFIREHREMLRFPDSDGKPPITFHGLRHTYVAEHYTRLRKNGDSDKEACKKLAPLLGHKRPEIVHAYLTKALVAQFGEGEECRIMKEEEFICI
jgi:integrase